MIASDLLSSRSPGRSDTETTCSTGQMAKSVKMISTA